MLDWDIIVCVLQMLPPLQEHHAQEQTVSDSHEHLWEQWTMSTRHVKVSMRQNLRLHSQHPEQL